ncbi:MAG: 2-oxo acid dehydrogenase subunit E2 [Clostridia bacterium]|nr:2-oxo acid dehydrogenase subunit E2 [Clostridia bacterium]
MSMDVHMPRLGMSMKEGNLVRWIKKEGEAVKKGEPLAEIASEKITNEIEAPADGFLNKIIVLEGETVAVGAVVATLSESAASSSAPETQQENKVEEAVSKGPKTVLEEKPLSGLRRTIGERMSQSLKRSPQGTMTTRADMTELAALKADYADGGIKISYTDMLVKIVGIALEKNPVLNSSIVDGKQVFYKSVNIGVGVGTEDGLFVPVVKNVEEKDLLQISQELKEFSLKVKEKRIQPEDMSGSTFTISNLGMFDVDIVTPIINPPEAAILAVGATRKEVVVLEDDSTAVRPLTTLSLTADHAVMDGIPAVTFLSNIKEIMRNPQEFLGNL